MQLKLRARLHQLRRFWHLPSAVARVEEQQQRSQQTADEAFDFLLRRLGRLDSTTETIERWLIGDESTPGHLSGPVANLLNRAEGHLGYRSQNLLWINQPIQIEYGPNRVEWVQTNERIVEIPFVLQALATLPIPSRILDVGSCESLIPFHLASLGHDVTAMDPREYRFGHPRLRVAQDSIIKYDAPEGPFDAVVMLSTIEHLGRDEYGNRQIDSEADLQTMRTVRQILKPGGSLVLTTAWGMDTPQPIGRTYRAREIERLLQGFTVESLGIASRVDARTWTTDWSIPFHSLTDHEPFDDVKVILIRAERSGE